MRGERLGMREGSNNSITVLNSHTISSVYRLSDNFY